MSGHRGLSGLHSGGRAPSDSLSVEAYGRARRVGLAPAIMERALIEQRAGRPFVVELEHVPGPGHFYRCALEGGSRVLYLNTAHPFYLECYSAPGATAGFRDGLEVMLWVLGLAELNAPDEETRRRYVSERVAWSQRLYVALPILADLMGFADEREAEGWEEP